MRGHRRYIPRRVARLRGRSLLSFFATLAVTGGLAVAGSGTPPVTLDPAVAAQARPNIVVIETDDQTVESMRVMDNVNSLIGDQGATFENSFVNFSLCCPSRATFLTGQYAHNHGVLGNEPPNGGFGRFQALHGSNNLGRLASPSRLLHRDDRQVPERLREPTRGSRLAGRSGARRPRTRRRSTTTR